MKKTDRKKARKRALKKLKKYALLGRKRTGSVGKLRANDWGFKDMIGNVWEWTDDLHDEDYYTKISKGEVDFHDPANLPL